MLFSSVAVANPNNYIGIDADGNIYELNYGASSGSLNIDEMESYETYSTQGTDIIYMDMATQAELDAIELTPGETGATGATGSTDLLVQPGLADHQDQMVLLVQMVVQELKVPVATVVLAAITLMEMLGWYL